MELAANELGFPLKDLLYSPQVNYMFAQFVGTKFVKPTSNAYASAIGGGEVQYRISSGFYTGQQQSKWLLGCKEWFKEVYYKTLESNPELAKRLSDELNLLHQTKREILFDAKNLKKDILVNPSRVADEDFLEVFKNDIDINDEKRGRISENTLTKIRELITRNDDNEKLIAEKLFELDQLKCREIRVLFKK
jgi:hypothetical protein